MNDHYEDLPALASAYPALYPYPNLMCIVRELELDAGMPIGSFAPYVELAPEYFHLGKVEQVASLAYRTTAQDQMFDYLLDHPDFAAARATDIATGIAAVFDYDLIQDLLAQFPVFEPLNRFCEFIFADFPSPEQAGFTKISK